uniref:Hemerythrin-like domain-containing protein n=1 Tax=Populus davidiana TaxID=266767 RepID=A0A6M2EPE2_9ROSI
MAEIAPYDLIKSTTAVHLYGDPATSSTLYIHFALLYKTRALQFTPTNDPQPVVQIGSETISGTREMMFRFIDVKLPRPPLAVLVEEGGRETAALVVKMAVLQHRAVVWHLERMVRWSEDLVTRGGRRNGDPAMGSERMEVKKFQKSYSQLLEVMVEHAQMEERVVFPLLETAERGLCKAANEEHGRDLPIMNGIREDMKSIGVLDTGSNDYREALRNLSTRLKSLLEHSKEHFQEEERDVLPLMEALELGKDQQLRVLEQCIDVMQGTHSHLFSFFIEGLLPREAMQYLDLITRCKEEKLVASMLRRIIE